MSDAPTDPAAPVANADADHPSVFQRLEKDACHYDFFWAVRSIKCATADKPRIGQSHRLEQDAVRFTQEPTLAFPPSTVTGFKPAQPHDPADPTTPSIPAKLDVRFFGMWGPQGPLPLHLTEYARQRERSERDPTLTGFMNLFHHRLISLFYRAWACNQQTVSFDRAKGHHSMTDDRFASYVASTVGRGMESMSKRDVIHDDAKLHYSGRLTAQTAHAEGLAAILSDYFKVPCEIEPFIGQWIELPAENRCELGRRRHTGTLGESVIAGSSVWNCQLKFRIHLGPMSLKEFRHLLPDQPGYAQLKAWVRNYIGDSLQWDARLTLNRPEVPQVCLGKLGQLGWTSWLLSGKATQHGSELLLHAS